MKPTTMNNIVTLLQIKEGYGHDAEDEILQSTIIWASIKDVSTSTKINAQSVGIKADLSVHCWRKEFEKYSYTHVDIGSIRYKIVSTGSSDNDLKIKLIVSRCG